MEQSPFPLGALSDDLLIVVFEHLREMSEYSLDACTGVCHRFYRLAIPIKYRSVLLINIGADHARMGRLRNKNSQLPLFVREATLDDRYSLGSDDAEPLMDVVRTAPYIKKFVVWGSYKFSQPLLDLIASKLPKSEIEYHAEFPREDEGWYDGWGTEEAIVAGIDGFSSPQLRTLHIDRIWAGFEREVVRRSLEKIIKNSPNLKDFTAYSSPGYHEDLDLNLSPSDHLPTLEYFAHIPIAYRSVRTWGQVTGWHTLRALKVTPASVLPAFASGGLHNLRYLAVKQYQEADDYNKVTKLAAPIRTLSIALNEDQLPLQFLGLFRDTLKSLMIFRERGTSVRGFSALDMRQLRETFPRLRKLYVRPYVDETSPALPRDFLEELSQFENLEVLILGMENYSKLQPSEDLCLDSYKTVRGSNRPSSLRRLALIHEYQATESDEIDDLFRRSKVSCVSRADGVMISPKRERYDDYDNKRKLCKEAVSKALDDTGRVFSKKFEHIWGERSEKDIIWAAKQLGPGPEWARTELVSAGLLTQQQVDDSWTPGNMNFMERMREKCESEESLEELRGLMKEELKYWNAVWEQRQKYGRYYSLYDVLYPRKEEF